MGVVGLALVLAGAALASPRARELLRSNPVFARLNTPALRAFDAWLYNLRHAPATPAELGDGGTVARVRLFDPMGLDRDQAGNLYVTDRGGPGNGRVVWRLGADGTARVVAGTGRRGVAHTGIDARDSDLGSPQALSVDAAGRVYFADSYNHVVLRVETSGTLTRVAGTGSPGVSGDGGPATAASLNQPYDVRLHPDGGVYIADVGNHRIRYIDPDGTIHTVAGTGAAGHSGDGGDAVAARLRDPYGVFAPAGIGFLIGDSGNDVIRVVEAGGTIRTLAGNGTRGLEGDGGPAVGASLNSPQGLYVTAAGSIYFSDEHNHAVRVIEPDGTIRRVAGTGRPGISGDGAPAASAPLHDPENILVLDDDTVLFTEAGNGRLRRIDGDGRLRTIAGGIR